MIVNPERTLVVFTEACRSLNVRFTDGKSIMASFRDGVCRDVVLGSYDSEEKTAVAFGRIIYALQSGADCVVLPGNDEPELVEAARPAVYSGFKGKNMLKTTGKTK